MHIGTIAICKDTNKDPAVVNASALDDASIHRPQLVRQINSGFELDFCTFRSDGIQIPRRLTNEDKNGIKLLLIFKYY